MKKGLHIAELLRSTQTVFSSKDIMLLWGTAGSHAVRERISYYVRQGQLLGLRRGFYAKDKNYQRLELACKIYTPAYVSFETVLAQVGVVFQYYSQIFVASYLTREIVADGQTYTYKKIKDSILTHHAAGVEHKNNYSMACPERAFLDVIYAYHDYHFDNLSPLNWDKVYQILPIYGGNRRMAKRVKMYHEAYKSELLEPAS